MNQLALTPKLVAAEPRIFDMVLGEHLGYERPDQIRRLIESHRNELEDIGGDLVRARSDRTGSYHGSQLQDEDDSRSDKSVYRHGTQILDAVRVGTGRPAMGFWLNRPQSILVAILSGAPNAPAVRRQVIEGFLAWERGEVKTRKERWPRLSSLSVTEDPWLKTIEFILEREDFVRCRDVHDLVVQNVGQLLPRARQEVYTRVGLIMRWLGWRRVHARYDGKLRHCYTRGPAQLSLLQ